MSIELAHRGGRVVCADIDETAAKSTVALVEDLGGSATARWCDVGDLAAVETLADQAVLDLDGPVDLVVNNAGVGSGGARVGETALADWHRTLDVNLWGVVHGCHVFTPRLRETGGGIINVASAASFAAAPRMAAYSAGKAAVLSLSETLAAELSGSGVAVTVLCPTFVQTNIIGDELITAPAADLARRLMRATGADPADIVAATLDAHARGRLHVLPQWDARLLWRLKRLAPATYTHAAGLINRLADALPTGG